MSTPLPPAPPPASSGPDSGTSPVGPAPRPAPRTKWKLTILVMLIALTVGTVVGAFGGTRGEESHWRALYDREVTDAAHWKSDSNSWHKQSDQYLMQLQILHQYVKRSVGDLDHPRFTIWDVRQTLDANRILFGSVPDTFRWSLDIRSTGSPITVFVMTDDNYACFFTKTCSAHWHSWGPSTHIVASWDAARGCAGYVWVITSTGPTTLIPKETITRDPADSSTGACRG